MKKILGVLRIVVLICALSIVSTNASAYIDFNGSGDGYGGDESESTSKSVGIANSIERYIEISGGYYLSAQSTLYTILNRIELQNLNGIDYDELRNLASNAIYRIRSAKIYYGYIIYLAQGTPYNTSVISRLESFDYNDFEKRNELNPAIFGEVKCYLRNGDINGLFIRKYKMCEILEDLLLSVEKSFYENSLPNLNTFWKLNELFSETALFGSYVARVFHAI